MVDIRYTIRERLRLPFEKIANEALGKGYQLSLVICGDRLAQRMNKEYRKKTYRPNVLSFPLSKTEGEIFLNIRKAAREAKHEGIPRDKRVALLFVHGCFHLVGYDHSDRMEALEQKVLKKFKMQ
jgi:probable rRNA maturation factor